MDGIIVTNNQKHKRANKSNPKYSFAFKDVLDEQVANFNVLGVEWNVSKDGYINPVLLLETQTLGGVDISMRDKPGKAGFNVYKKCYDSGVNIKPTGDALIIAPPFV